VACFLKGNKDFPGFSKTSDGPKEKKNEKMERRETGEIFVSLSSLELARADGLTRARAAVLGSLAAQTRADIASASAPFQNRIRTTERNSGKTKKWTSRFRNRGWESDQMDSTEFSVPFYDGRACSVIAF
jgi:hypothetical protein